jgi:hypothetical protein
MDFQSFKNYLTSLALLYAWTLFAAAAFALGERLCRNVFAPERPALSDGKSSAKS